MHDVLQFVIVNWAQNGRGGRFGIYSIALARRFAVAAAPIRRRLRWAPPLSETTQKSGKAAKPSPCLR
jgi:hypothetical protein